MIGTARFISVYFLMLAAWAFIHFHADKPVPVVKPLVEFPATFQEWRMVSQSRFNDEVLELLKPSDYLSRQYTGSVDRKVSVYIGYHDGGKNSGEIHSPKHCLPGSGWQEISSDRMELPMQQGNVCLVKAVYQKGDRRELFFYWFQMQEKTLSNEYALKLAEIMNSLIHRRRDAAFIRISVPLAHDENDAETTGLNFIHDIYPLIRTYLPS